MTANPPQKYIAERRCFADGTPTDNSWHVAKEGIVIEIFDNEQHATLFADALNQHAASGLTPSQMAERIKDAEENLEFVVAHVDRMGELLGVSKDHIAQQEEIEKAFLRLYGEHSDQLKKIRELQEQLTVAEKAGLEAEGELATLQRERDAMRKLLELAAADYDEIVSEGDRASWYLKQCSERAASIRSALTNPQQPSA